MAEFKLICPGCRAEYAVPPDAIPQGGREVECPACGHVWQAHPPASAGRLDLGSFSRKRPDDDETPRPLPPARTRLSPDVLDMLKSEVDHERRLRDAEQMDDVRATADEVDWPATTVTLPPVPDRPVALPPPPPVIAPPAPAAPDVARQPEMRQPEPHQPELRQPEPRQPELRQPELRQQAETAVHRRAAATPIRVMRHGRGFGAGMMLALLVAAAVLAVYLLAPVAEARGWPLAGTLTEARDGLDGLRQWLADRIGA